MPIRVEINPLLSSLAQGDFSILDSLPLTAKLLVISHLAVGVGNDHANIRAILAPFTPTPERPEFGKTGVSGLVSRHRIQAPLSEPDATPI